MRLRPGDSQTRTTARYGSKTPFDQQQNGVVDSDEAARSTDQANTYLTERSHDHATLISYGPFELTAARTEPKPPLIPQTTRVRCGWRRRYGGHRRHRCRRRFRRRQLDLGGEPDPGDHHLGGDHRVGRNRITRRCRATLVRFRVGRGGCRDRAGSRSRRRATTTGGIARWLLAGRAA